MADGTNSGSYVWPTAGPPSGSLAGGTTSVSWWQQVVRPDDLLSLTFGLVNLTVQDGQLVRVDPGSPAAIIVGLPPQHVTEASMPSTDALPAQVTAAIAGGSQLAFTVPDGVTSLPLNLPTLLGWAALEPVPPSAPAGQAARPSASGSILELPYRMLLAVDGAQWQHSTAAVVDPATGTAELWRTTASAPALHVAWSQDLEPSEPGTLPNVDDPLSGLRSQIAGQAPALEVDSLTLSALGATTSLHAALPDSPLANVTDWHHIMSLGRDSYVRIVQRGYLAPFGHPAAIVTVTERAPVTASPLSYVTGYGPPEPFEELIRTSRIVILSPQVDYTAPAAAAAYSAKSPVMTVPLRKVSLPDLAAPLVVDPGLATTGGVIQTSSQEPFSFRAVAEDLSGTSVELSMPMAFVPEPLLGTASTIYQGLANDLGPTAAAAVLNGQSVAFVGVPGAVAAAVDRCDGTVLPVDSMSFKLFFPPDPGIPFLPQLQDAAVRVPSAIALAGDQAEAWTIQYHPDYLMNGIDTAVNPGSVFASVTSQAVVQLAASAAGGLAAPQLEIDGLSRALGPVAGAADLIKGQFDPTSLLSQFDQARFLGGIKLSDILAPIEARTFDPAKVPGFVRSQLPQAIQTTFTWKPPLHGGLVTPPPVTGTSGTSGTSGSSGTASLGGLTIDTSKSTLSLSVTVTAPLDPSLTPTSEMTGQLAGVTLTFMSDVKLGVDLLTFTARSGRKVDLKMGHLTFTFTGNLAFLDELVQALPAAGFGDAPYVDADATGVTAGYSLAIPSIGIGIISIENVAFEAALSLPLALPPQPLDLRVCFSTREHPFLVSVAFIGGGGYFCADVGSDGVHLIEGSLDLGANLSVDLVVVSAEVHVLAGFYFGVSQTGTSFSGFVRIGGSVNLLGLISVSVELYLALAYSNGQSAISGTASLTLSLHVLFITKSVTLSVKKSFPVPGSANSARAVPALPALTARPADATGPQAPGAAAPGPVSFSDLISPDDWNLYLSAFA